MFSQRTAWPLSPNALSTARQRREQAGLPLLDLCESNPTRVGLSPSWQELEPLLLQPQAASYSPDPLGLLSARQAVAALHAQRVPAEQIVLSASTSEAYAWAFKLLCDPGDTVLIPTPSYPLFDYLAGLEAVQTASYPLHLVGDEWYIDTQALEQALTPRTRAVLVVSPANPTGSVLHREEARFLEAWCGERGLALICDEVFADTLGSGGGDVSDRQDSCAGFQGCLTIVLSGLSKVCLLPQLKCGWMLVSGPQTLVDSAMQRLEIIADTWLSVATPIQLALPGILALRPQLQERLIARLKANRQILARALRDGPATLLAADGGWSALLRLPKSLSDEQRAMDLLEQHGLVVQPGWYFDLPGEGWLVLGLLQPVELFEPAARRLAQALLHQG